jgi:hypothetical protein
MGAVAELAVGGLRSPARRPGLSRRIAAGHREAARFVDRLWTVAAIRAGILETRG